MHFVCGSLVQPTTVFDDVTNHPRGGTSADDQKNVVIPRSDVIPKPTQFFDETRILEVEARDFVDENHTTFLALVFLDNGSQSLKSLFPILRFGALEAIFGQGRQEGIPLVFPISFQYAAGKKVEFILKEITNKGVLPTRRLPYKATNSLFPLWL